MSQVYFYPAPVTAAPVGGATAANQVLEIAQLTAINANTDNLPAALGQQVMNASLPVVIASNQTAIPVSGPLTDTQLRATPVPISGTVTTGGLTDTQLRATPVPISGTVTTGGLTDTQLRATPVPISGTVTANAGTNLNTSALALETTQSAMSAKLPAVLGQTTMAGSLSVTIASNQTAIPTSQVSVVSTNNSSTTPLGISGVFTGTSDNVQDYASIEITVFANQASAANGLSMQQSQDGTNWDIIDAYSITASTGRAFSLGPAARFFRVVYTNGVAAQATFRLQVVYHYNTVKASTHSLADAITLQNDAELVVAQMRATNGTNTVALVADASNNLSVNLNAVAGTAVNASAGVVAAGTQRMVMGSGSTATTASVAASASSVTVLAAITSRLGATFYNDSSALAYLKFGATASTTSFTVLLQPSAYYEIPGPHIYNGIIDCIWASATGSMRVTSW